MKDEGYYNDEWYRLHGAHDEHGSIKFDKEGQPIADVEHYYDRDHHT